MVSCKSLSVALLATTALAAPAPHGNWGKKIVWSTVVKTAYVTVYPGQYHPTPKSSVPAVKASSTPLYTPIPVEPKPTPSSTIVIVEKRPSSSKAPAYTPAPVPSSSAPAYTPAPVSSAPAYTPVPKSSTPVVVPSSTKAAEPAPTGGADYMSVVDEWRGKLGLKKLNWSAKLEANALDTVKSSNGQMVHKLNPGTYGQVLAPGKPDEFYHCFVGGWLCEKPSMAGMNGVCDSASKGWYYTSTGHADILTDDKYTQIACANFNGIWGCDVA